MPVNAMATSSRLLPALFAWVTLAGLVPLVGCQNSSRVEVGGNPERGQELIRDHGCGSCHVIPGIRGAGGRVGPSLERIARRAYIGGVSPNTPEHMIRWLKSPGSVDPLTAMPDVGVDTDDATDIAAYLYRLE